MSVRQRTQAHPSTSHTQVHFVVSKKDDEEEIAEALRVESVGVPTDQEWSAAPFILPYYHTLLQDP